MSDRRWRGFARATTHSRDTDDLRVEARLVDGRRMAHVYLRDGDGGDVEQLQPGDRVADQRTADATGPCPIVGEMSAKPRTPREQTDVRTGPSGVGPCR